MKPAVGRVYVLSNKATPGLLHLKIGYTMNDLLSVWSHKIREILFI